jgi:probable F420-dependent oxidoreductase
MKLGLALPHAGEQASPAAIAEAAMGAEEIGLDSVWVLDRVLRPRAPVSGEAIPEFYATVFDPLETLSYVAGLTSRVQLGTSVVQALFHPPVVLARRLATLDRFSGGRLVAGLGQGWMPEEFAVAGVRMSRRGRGFEEYVAALRAAWGPDPVRFDGDIYRIPESDIGPKPHRPDGVPVLVGYTSAVTIERAAGFADSLHPNRSDFDTLRTDVELFRGAAEAAGRDPSSLPIVLRAAARLTDTAEAEADRSLFVGTVAQWAADCERVAAIGIDHVFLGLRAPVSKQLEAMVELRERVPADRH